MIRLKRSLITCYCISILLVYSFAFEFATFSSFSKSKQYKMNKNALEISALNTKTSKISLHMTAITKPDVAIIGGGPAGLTTAIMLARRGYDKIKVYEKFSEPQSPDSPVWSSVESERTYNIGISGRGQNLLKHINVMNIVDQYSTGVLGRCYWEPDTPVDKPMELVWSNRSYTTKCIPRDCLTSCLIHEINTKYNQSIQIYFNSLCSKVSVHKIGNLETCHLEFYDTKNAETKTWTTQASWVIGTDGSQSSVRDSMLKSMNKNQFYFKRYEDKNIRVYRTIPLYIDENNDVLLQPLTTDLPPMVGLGSSSITTKRSSTPQDKKVDSSTTLSASSSQNDVNWNVLLTGSGNNNMNVKNKLTNNIYGKDYSSAKVRKWKGNLNYSARTKVDINIDALPLKNGPYLGVILYRPWDEKLKNIKTGQDARQFFNRILPMFSPFVRDEDLSVFANKSDSTLPVFSYAGPVLHKGKSICLLGDTIHTVKPYFGLGLNSALEDVQYLEMALTKYKDNLEKALPYYSKMRAREAKALVKISRSLDGGFLTFVLPLIIDSILHKKLPWLFNPNTITLLQNEKLTFTQVQYRKRRDRFFQIMIVGLVGLFVHQIILLGSRFILFVITTMVNFQNTIKTFFGYVKHTLYSIPKLIVT